MNEVHLQLNRVADIYHIIALALLLIPYGIIKAITYLKRKHD